MRNPLEEYSLDDLRRRRSTKWRGRPADVLPLWVAEMDTAPAEPIRQVLLDAVNSGDLGYAHVDGRLFEAFAGFAERRYGWKAEPARMRLIPDVSLGIAEVLRQVTAPGDGVVINPPVYPPFFHHIADVGRKVVESPLGRAPDGRWFLDLDRLERDFAAGAAAYLLCNPHNPTGTVYTRAELLAVADLAGRYDVRVLVDEIHAPLTYQDARHTPFLDLDTEASSRAVAFVSASKAWNLAGLKAAVAVGGSATGADLGRISAEFSDGVGHLGVLASEAAFELGEPWLAALLDGLDANRRLLATLLAEHLPEVRYVLPEATYLAWLDCTALDLPGDPAAVFGDRGRVALVSGPTFGAPGTGHVRFNLATSAGRITEAVRRMVSARTAR